MWMEKYDEEIEARDTEIHILKDKREELFTRLQAVTDLVRLKLIYFYNRPLVKCSPHLKVIISKISFFSTNFDMKGIYQ